MMRTEWSVIGRGKAGWHANAGNVTSSGGSLLPEFGRSGYLAEAADGALVYDAEDAPYEVFARAVVSGPMVNPTIGAWECDHAITRICVAIAPVEAITVDELRAQNIRSLDYIGIGLFEALLRSIHNIRIGHVSAGKVIWA